MPIGLKLGVNSVSTARKWRVSGVETVGGGGGKRPGNAALP